MRNNSRNIVEFTLIYNQYKTKLYSYAMKMIYDKMVCDDIIQNSFIKLFENLDKIRNKESVQYWLFTTVRNEIYTHFRRKKIKVDQFNVADVDDTDMISDDKIDYDFEQKEVRELIMIQLNKMTIDQRDVFLLKEYGGLSYKEIAVMMNINEELVKSRLHKTRQKLIRKLSPLLI